MKLALIGYGKMGQLIEQMASIKGHQIVARFSSHLGTLNDRLEELFEADLVMDFSQTSCVLSHLKLCLSASKPLIIGTTGWEKQKIAAQEIVQKSGGSCLYSPNFSIGIYLFKHIIAYAANLFQPFPDYDVTGIEYHHHQKIDKPSGTAKELSKELLQNMPRLKELNFSSIRCGHIPGTHTLYFDSLADTLIFTHQARNRQGFAHGAILAAEWLLHRKGFFTIDDMMKDYFGDKPLCN